eukprot:SAG11_NODE_188_length_13029_cov_3.652514_1_plen_72_part_00
MNNFKIGDMVWINSQSIKSGTSSCCDGEPECVKIIKITPKRFEIEWDADGCREEPFIVYVKNVYRKENEVK